jgi:signal transduction histidine kinase
VKTSASPTLFSVLLRNTLVAFGVFIVVFLLVFGAGFWVTRGQYQQAAGQRIAGVMANELTLLVDRDGGLQGEVVNRVLMNQLDQTVFILVFRADGTLIFWSWRGDSWYREDSPDEVIPGGLTESDILTRLPANERPAPSQTLYQRLQELGKLKVLVHQGVAVGAYYTGPHTVRTVEQSLRFLRSLVLALFGGLAAAALVATGFAWRAFRRSADQARAVQSGLLKIAGGQRDVVLAPPGSRELDGIAASALSLQAALVREQSLRRQWAEDIAHDLKTPLAGLRVQVAGLAEGVLTPDPGRLRLLLGELDRLEALTGNLLVLSRLESPELTLHRRSLRLEDLTVPLQEHFVALAEGAGRRWQWTESDGGLTADPELLYRALADLLSNAVNHASGEGDLEAQWSAGDEGFLAVIRNPGQLSAADEPYLFQRLHRGEASRSGRGNGLGLAIAQTVCRLHGGNLTVKNLGPDRVEARFSLPPA